MKPLLIIPMTGVSARFTAAGYDVPKFMLEVDGQTVIDHVIDMYPGWEDVIFCCNPVHLDDPRLDLERRLLERRPNATILRVPNNTKGPGWAVWEARALIDPERPVVVNYCDFTCYWDAQELADELLSGDVEGCIPSYTGFHPHMAFSTSYAYVKMRDGLAVDIQEKQPWSDDPQSEFASSGTYAFASGRILLEALEEQMNLGLTLNDEYYLSLTFKPIMDRGGRVSVLELQHFMQWGTPQDFEEYRDTSSAIAAWTRPRAGHSASELGAARVVLASGAGSRFASAGYTLPKPLLPLSGITVLEHSVLSLPDGPTVVVARSDLDGDVDSVTNKLGATVVTVPGLTRGQAASALAGLRALPLDLPVTVTACDAISVVATSEVDRLFREVGADGLVVWVAKPYHLAMRRPEQYGWIEIDARGSVGRTWMKSAPDTEAGVIVGTFGFGSVRAAIAEIESLIADDETINGEYYLDSLVARMSEAGRHVAALSIPSFVSVGTPTEYETARYWQSCFEKWPLHPYTLAGDPLVPSISRTDLHAEFAVFEPRLP